jgi:hypothetical protein
LLLKAQAVWRTRVVLGAQMAVTLLFNLNSVGATVTGFHWQTA